MHSSFLIILKHINWYQANPNTTANLRDSQLWVISAAISYDKYTIRNPKIIERINEKYIAIKFNPEKPGKYFAGSKDSLSGRQLLMALSNNKPSGYPTFFFFVPQDAKLFQLPGYQDANQFGATMNNIEKYQAQLITKD